MGELVGEKAFLAVVFHGPCALKLELWSIRASGGVGGDSMPIDDFTARLGMRKLHGSSTLICSVVDEPLLHPKHVSQSQSASWGLSSPAFNQSFIHSIHSNSISVSSNFTSFFFFLIFSSLSPCWPCRVMPASPPPFQET